MKSTSLPSPRVDAQLRADAEGVLRDGETLSAFIATAVRESVDRRRAQAEFVARGLESRGAALQGGQYFKAELVHAELGALLSQARQRLKAKAQA